MGRAMFTGRFSGARTSAPHRSADAGAEPHAPFALLILAPILLLRNRSSLQLRGTAPVAVLPAGNSRARRLELLLLFRHREDDGRDGDRAAICRAGLGAALHAGAAAATSNRAAHQRRAARGHRLRGCGGRSRSAQQLSLAGHVGSAHQLDWRSWRRNWPPMTFAFYNVYGQHLLQIYQRWTVLVYSLFGAAVFWIVVNPPWKIAAQHYSGAQWLFMAAVLDRLDADSFFALLHRTAVSGSDARDRDRLPRTGLGDSADGDDRGRIGFADSGSRNRSSCWRRRS